MIKVAVVILIFASTNCSAGSSWKVTLNVSVSSTISSLVIFVLKEMRCGLIGHGSMTAVSISLVKSNPALNLN